VLRKALCSRRHSCLSPSNSMPALACPRALARLSSRPPSRRALSTTPARAAHRALVYAQPGTPASVLRALTFPMLPPPAPGTATVRFLAAPLNPADVNALEGAYPARAARAADALCAAAGEEVRVGGNEGVAEVVEAGEGAGVQPGDWGARCARPPCARRAERPTRAVLVAKPQSGTWTSAANHAGADLIPLARSPKLTAAHAATLTVRPRVLARARDS
jgi:trans-2-enoyl-CoA reductase